MSRTVASVERLREILWSHPKARAAIALSETYAQTVGRRSRPADTRPRPEPAGSIPVLGAIILAAWPVLADAQPKRCPTAADWTGDTLALPAGCPAPAPGRLYTPEAHAETAAEMAALDSLIEDRDAQLADARSERDLARQQAVKDLADAARRIDALNGQVAALSDPPRRTVWLAFGGLIAGGALVGSDLAGLDSLASAGLGVGALAVGALVGAWLDGL